MATEVYWCLFRKNTFLSSGTTLWHHCDALRFLWWSTDDLTPPPEEYKVIVHVFSELHRLLVVHSSFCLKNNKGEFSAWPAHGKEHLLEWLDINYSVNLEPDKEVSIHAFVANRLSVIHDGSSPEQWRYVDSKSNPADDVSRGLTAEQLIRNERL